MSRKRNPERAAVRIARKLVDRIRRQRLRPGTQLASEHKMVEELGVNPAGVHVALHLRRRLLALEARVNMVMSRLQEEEK